LTKEKVIRAGYVLGKKSDVKADPGRRVNRSGS